MRLGVRLGARHRHVAQPGIARATGKEKPALEAGLSFQAKA